MNFEVRSLTCDSALLRSPFAPSSPLAVIVCHSGHFVFRCLATIRPHATLHTSKGHALSSYLYVHAQNRRCVATDTGFDVFIVTHACIILPRTNFSFCLYSLWLRLDPKPFFHLDVSPLSLKVCANSCHAQRCPAYFSVVVNCYVRIPRRRTGRS